MVPHAKIIEYYYFAEEIVTSPTILKQSTSQEIENFTQQVIQKNPGEPEFHQAVQEVAEAVIPFTLENPEYKDSKILERLIEPERIVIFRVCWEDDNGNIQINRGFRVQFNSAIGPYKGGLRFHPSVSLGTFKFLGFEQIFKNSLTTLPMGAGKGGSDFDPKGKSDREVMRFCQSFMLELHRHIGSNVDIPAGDIGVGAREISYLFGAYKKISNNFTGTITGKSLMMGGSLIRKESTGYGCVYFMEEMLNLRGDTVKGKTATVSGSGNVAQYATEKLLELGAKVVTLSDSSGFIYDAEGITKEKLAWVIELKNVKRGRISEYTEKYPSAKFYANKKPWSIPCDLAFPCATQNELDLQDAQELSKNNCIAVSEGANMPSTPEAIKFLKDKQILLGVGKAANAGGVAISGLEMAQNRMGYSWERSDLEHKLKSIMNNIHTQCLEHGKVNSTYVDYATGATVAGFKKVADAMLAYGVS
ncbi:NADP-specific glutamate dehydrogenase [Candidatus Marinamargulisbacteria bacterium SCGC AG-414-C22]|nr:NADP-specific glutamate dehydrogenase [Candidatus Marinamargulisbacteria bacterium SCGC AG-414-C22]